MRAAVVWLCLNLLLLATPAYGVPLSQRRPYMSRWLSCPGCPRPEPSPVEPSPVGSPADPDPPTRFQPRPHVRCRPTRREVVQFLRALHLARSGRSQLPAVLCTFTRPAGRFDTPRFVG